MAFSALILAGGASRRMGRDKALIPFQERTLVERVAEALAPFTDDLMVSVDRPGRPLPLALPARRITDLHPDKGPLAGIYAGLLAARHERCIVAPCDMPFIQAAVLDLLLSVKADAVTPWDQPLLGVYSKASLPVIGAMLREGRLRVVDVPATLVAEEAIRLVDPKLQTLVNVNLPEDLRRAGP